MIKPPCAKDCPNRSATCHAECEDYILFDKKKKEEREMILKKKREFYDSSHPVIRKRII